MPGRAFPYMNQNLGLMQQGLSEAANSPALADHYRQRQQQEALNKPASPVQQYIAQTAGQLISQAQQRVAAGDDPREVAIQTRFFMQQLQQGNPIPPQFLGGQSEQEQQPLSPPPLVPADGGGMNPASLSSFSSAASSPSQAVGGAVGGMAGAASDIPTLVRNTRLPSVQSVQAAMARQSPAAVSPPPSLPQMQGGMSGVPPINTVEDYQTMMQGAQGLRAWMNSPGANMQFPQQMAMFGPKLEAQQRNVEEQARAKRDVAQTQADARLGAAQTRADADRDVAGIKTEGSITATGMRTDTAKQVAKLKSETALEIARMQEHGRNARWKDSVGNVHNAVKMMRDKINLMLNGKGKRPLSPDVLRAKSQRLTTLERSLGNVMERLEMASKKDRPRLMQEYERLQQEIVRSNEELDAQMARMSGPAGVDVDVDVDASDE